MSQVPKVVPDAVQASPQLQGSPETKVTAAQAARDKRGAKRPEQAYPPVNRSQFHNPDQGSLF